VTDDGTTKAEIEQLWVIHDRLGRQRKRAEEEMDLIEDQLSEVRKQLRALGDTNS
jgi:uncharacterized protein YfkK (UPF0435 family)